MVRACYLVRLYVILCSDFVRELFGVCSGIVRKKGVFTEKLPNNSRTNPEETSNKVRARYEAGTNKNTLLSVQKTAIRAKKVNSCKKGKKWQKR
jgi:hypothetical protein